MRREAILTVLPIVAFCGGLKSTLDKEPSHETRQQASETDHPEITRPREKTHQLISRTGIGDTSAEEELQIQIEEDFWLTASKLEERLGTTHLDCVLEPHPQNEAFASLSCYVRSGFYPIVAPDPQNWDAESPYQVLVYQFSPPNQDGFREQWDQAFIKAETVDALAENIHKEIERMYVYSLE